MSAKERAIELYRQHLHLLETSPREFRKTVMEALAAETGGTTASCATHYNNAKKAHEADQATPTGITTVRRNSKGRSGDVADDLECYTVLELVGDAEFGYTVGRTRSHEGLGVARITLKNMKEEWPSSEWRLINGLGPNPGDDYKLEPGEKEIA